MVPASTSVPHTFLMRRESDILPHDLLLGCNQRKKTGRRMQVGGRGGAKPGTCGSLGPGEGMDKGALPTPPYQSLLTSPMDTHTQRWFVPGIAVSDWGQHARCHQHSAWYAVSAQQV